MAEEFEVPTEAQRVARALLGVAAAAAGREPRVPSMGEEYPGYALPTLDEALVVLANTELVNGPVRTQVFSAVYSRTGRTDLLDEFAKSLLRTDLALSPDQQRRVVDRIFERAQQQLLPWGRDLLQRQPLDLLASTQPITELRADVLEFLVEFESVDCHASVVSTENTHAVSIETSAYTVRPLDELVEILDPRNWPKCALQHVFFKSMTEVGPLDDLDPPDASRPPPPQPLNNWKGRLREVVDWSLGADWLPFTTDLDVVFFRSPERAGCTYDIGPPVDHQVVVDRGYLIGEDLGALRRVRTLKQVHFAVGDIDPDFVCWLWGPVTQLLAWACIGHIH